MLGSFMRTTALLSQRKANAFFPARMQVANSLLTATPPRIDCGMMMTVRNYTYKPKRATKSGLNIHLSNKAKRGDI